MRADLFQHYRIVDLSMLIEEHWRFKPEFGIKKIPKQTFSFRSTILDSYGVHNFSHVDAPRHIEPDAPTIEQLDLERSAGSAALIDVSDLGDNAPLSKEVLQQRSQHVQSGDILLLRSDHELRHPTVTPDYWVESPWVTASGAQYLLELGIKAVAFDFPQDKGIRADYHEDFVWDSDPEEDWACHLILLKHGILQIEYLSNFHSLSKERFLFFAMPLKIKGSDGGPTRAFALEER